MRAERERKIERKREREIVTLERDGVWSSHMLLGVKVNNDHFRESHVHVHTWKLLRLFLCIPDKPRCS